MGKKLWLLVLLIALALTAAFRSRSERVRTKVPGGAIELEARASEPASKASVAQREPVESRAAPARTTRRRVLDGAVACLTPLGVPPEKTTSAALETARLCLATRDLRAITAEDYSDWLCSYAPQTWPRQIFLEELLLARTPAQALEFVDELVAVVCEEFEQSIPYSVLTLAEQRAPEWRAQLIALLDGQALFGGKSDGVLQLVTPLVQQQDPRLLELFELGAQGQFGGNEDQQGRALLVLGVYVKDANRRLALYEGVLASSALLAPSVGNHLAHLLCTGPFQEEPLRRRALVLCESALYDPVLGPAFAAQLMAEGSRHSGERDWERLVELARASKAR